VGRFVAAVLGLALVVLALPLLAGASDRLGPLTTVLPFASGCEVALVDGTSASLDVEEAAAAATAAARGEAVEGLTAAPALSSAEAIECRISSSAGPGEQALTDTGLTPRAQTVFDEVAAVFGPIPYGGFAPGGISTGHGARSAHYDGRAVDLFFRPVGDETQRARGWAVANWLVAHADRLEVAVVIFDDKIWSARRSAQGWRPYSNPTGASDPISRHLDHVHVDVVRGA